MGTLHHIRTRLVAEVVSRTAHPAGKARTPVVYLPKHMPVDQKPRWTSAGDMALSQSIHLNHTVCMGCGVERQVNKECGLPCV